MYLTGVYLKDQQRNRIEQFRPFSGATYGAEKRTALQ